MNNELTTTGTALAPVDPSVTLMDIRRDSTKFPRIARIPREQSVPQMARIVHQAFLYKGHNADPTTIQFIASSLVDELVADNNNIGTKWISMEEISRAVKKAVLTKEDFVSVSVSSLYKVIVEYVKGEGHQIEKDIRDAKVKENNTHPMLLAYAAQLTRKK